MCRIRRQREGDGKGDKSNADAPWIGLMFISFARSFEASCHSFVIVRGGGAAVHPPARVSKYKDTQADRRDAPSWRTPQKSTPEAAMSATTPAVTWNVVPGGLMGLRGPCGPNET
jgi:hypothetical protein